jgi:hypothetical protein
MLCPAGPGRAGKLGAPCNRKSQSKIRNPRFRGEVVWDGLVETFEVTPLPETKCCYAFLYKEDDGDKRVATVREAPKVNSPELAVRAFIATRAANH